MGGAATEMVIEMRTQMERVEDVLKYPVEQHEEVSRSEGSGKLKGRITVPTAYDAAQIEAFALADEKIQGYIDGKTVRKVIVVPGKIVNIVVK